MEKPHAAKTAHNALASVISFVTQPLSNHKKLLFGLTGAIALVGAPVAALSVHSSSNTGNNSPTPNAEVKIEQSTTTTAPGENRSDQGTSQNSVTVDTSTQGTQSTHGTVTVNGETIPLPQDGTVQKSVPSNEGNSSINVNIQSNNTSQQTHISNNSSSSSSVEIYSHSTSTGTSNNTSGPGGRNTLGR